MQEKTISQLLPNSTDLVISRQLGTIINTSYYVKLHLHRISAPAWTFLTEWHSGSKAHVASRTKNCVFLLAASRVPFSADVFNAVVLQNKIASKNTEIKNEGGWGGKVNKSMAAQRKNNFALVF